LTVTSEKIDGYAFICLKNKQAGDFNKKGRRTTPK
jgi:hypothetical protein